MLSDYNCLTRLEVARRLGARIRAHGRAAMQHGGKVIWQASLKTPIPPDPRIAASRARQVRNAERVFRSAIRPQSREMTQVTENDQLFGFHEPQKIRTSDGSSFESPEWLAEDDVADGSFEIPEEAQPYADWRMHDGVDLALWREYVAAANAGSFDFCAADALADRRRRREQAEAREIVIDDVSAALTEGGAK